MFHTFLSVSLYIEIDYLQRCTFVQNLLFDIAKKTQQKQLCSHIPLPFRYFSCR